MNTSRMKRNTLSLILMVALACAPALTACQGEGPVTPLSPRQDIPLTKTQEGRVAQGNDFGLKLFRQMAGTKAAADNLFISPLSLSMALSALSGGAQDQTLQEIQSLLGFKEAEAREMHEYFQYLVPQLQGVDTSTALEIANAIWLRQNATPQAAFVDLLDKHYLCKVATLPFGEPEAAATINRWCAQYTHNKITEIIDRTSPNDALYLTNALYFKGIWSKRFNARNNSQESFTRSDGSQTPITYMNATDLPVRYTQDKEVQVAALPYGNGAFEMVVVLPRPDYPAAQLIQDLDAAQWESWMKALDPATCDVKLPKFTLEYDSQDFMKEAVQSLGMQRAFTPQAQFGGIYQDPHLAHLYISLLKQKTFISVDESGTEAAAVTIIGAKLTSAGPQESPVFHVTRPFVYAIREVSTGVLLFLGVQESF